MNALATMLAAMMLAAILLAMTVTPLLAQQAESGPASAVITFTLDFPNSEPSHYSISVRADGHSTYHCPAKTAQTSTDNDSNGSQNSKNYSNNNDNGNDEELYDAEFEMSPANRQRIFDWARQTKYFAAKIDSGNSKLAFTGDKTLSYQDGPRHSTASYNYSTLPAVQQLTALFESMANTLDHGRRLVYYHRYQKLALDDELKQMETEAQSHDLSEIQAIAPVLQNILDDTSVMNVVRARAQRLLEMAKTTSAGPA